MLSYHVLGWDDAMAVCAANRARGEIDLVMLPTPQLPQVTMNTLRQIQGHSAALTPYEHPVCAPTDSPAGAAAVRRDQQVSKQGSSSNIRRAAECPQHAPDTRRSTREQPRPPAPRWPIAMSRCGRA